LDITGLFIIGYRKSTGLIDKSKIERLLHTIELLRLLICPDRTKRDRKSTA
jgi:hypothetical protein